MKEERKKRGKAEGRNGEEEVCKRREKKEEREGKREKEIEKRRAKFAPSPRTIVCCQPGRRILQLRTTCLRF